jgi:DNA-directed RNA polymerase alpha subunit
MKQFGNKSKRRTRQTKIDPALPCVDPRDEQKRLESWKSAPISALPGLPKRVVNCLELAEIRTVGDLQSKSRAELSELKNFGSASADICEERLQDCRLPGLRRCD